MNNSTMALQHYDPNELQQFSLSDFQMISTLGVGSYGKVFHAVLKNRQKESYINPNVPTQTHLQLPSPQSSLQTGYALKVIEKRLLELENKNHEIHVEIVVLTHIKSSQIVQMYCSFQDPLKIYFLLEYIQNGTLFDFLRRERVLQKSLVKHFAAELVSCLEVLRKSQIVHRDLKPNNIMLD